MAIVYAVINGYLDSVEVANVHSYEKRLFEKLTNEYEDLLLRFESGYYDDSDVETLKKALSEMQG